MIRPHCTSPLPYPGSKFPGYLRELLEGIAKHLNIDPALAGVEILATVAAGAQHRAVVKIPGYDPTPLGLFFQTVAGSSVGKSRAARIVGRAIRAYDEKCESNLEIQKAEFRFSLEEWQDKKEALRRLRRKAEGNPQEVSRISQQIKALEKPKKPVSHRLSCSDTTVPLLLEKLTNETCSAYLTHDEGIEFYLSETAKHIGKLNSAYSGIIEPKDRAHHSIESAHPRLTFNNRIQPSVFSQLPKRKRDYFLGIGFFDRTLFVVADSDDADPPDVFSEFDTEERKQFDGRLEELLESRDAKSSVAPHFLELEADALAEVVRIRRLVAADIRSGGPLFDIRGAALRLVENIIRIAGGVKFFLEGPGLISLEYIRFARDVGVWHLLEFQRLFSPNGCLSKEQENERRLEEFLRKRVGDPRFFSLEHHTSRSILTTAGPFRGTGATARVEESVASLAGRGMICILPGILGKKKDVIYQLTDRFFEITSSSNGFPMPSEASGRPSLRDYSTPCPCLRCRYCAG